MFTEVFWKVWQVRHSKSVRIFFSVTEIRAYPPRAMLQSAHTFG
jgi:hypothetical protein